MPTYQYECSECHHGFEALQPMSEPKLKQCPSCGQDKLDRLIGTGAGIIFKGSGFYETDYKKKEPSPSDSQKETKTEHSCGSSGGCSGTAPKEASSSSVPNE